MRVCWWIDRKSEPMLLGEEVGLPLSPKLIYGDFELGRSHVRHRLANLGLPEVRDKVRWHTQTEVSTATLWRDVTRFSWHL